MAEVSSLFLRTFSLQDCLFDQEIVPFCFVSVDSFEGIWREQLWRWWFKLRGKNVICGVCLRFNENRGLIFKKG